ncbi:MAG: TonB-dependent receptor plug domain-containing protein [Alphaproteobacteria bacterium]|nr:TonB-dependent receptor plug domain-containing protein [Alphaproteobacteria bacterium]
MRLRSAFALGTALLGLIAPRALGQEAAPTRAASEDGGEIVVTARRREERLQDVPVAVSVIGGERLDDTGSYSIGQITQLAPTLQYVSSNPRNTAFNIRGLGSSFGLANDGLEQGVGLYIDQVYYPRPAAASFDLLDIERIEILRGPQGTLFGKNTTAGALNVTTRAPRFTPESAIELSYGDYGFTQAKASVSGPLLGEMLAGRLSIATTRRDGMLYNVTTQRDVNDQNNVAVRGQLLYTPTPDLSLRFIADYNAQELECCTQGVVRVGETQRAPSQQYPALAAGLDYAPASFDIYDRRVDVNSDIQADQWQSGLAVIADWDLGFATMTSVSAARQWAWRPQNDRDYTALSILTRSANQSDQQQLSQELRLASNGERVVDWTVGLYFYRQEIDTEGVSEWGADAAYWLIGPSAPANLLDGYRADFTVTSATESYAAFAHAVWSIAPRWRLSGGVRYTEETKDAVYDQRVSGGLATTDPTLINRQLSIARPQVYEAAVEDGSASGQINLAWDVGDAVLAYIGYAQGYKSGGVNLAGIPTTASGAPALVNAVIAPENSRTLELGLKTQLFDRLLTANLALFRTVVEDYQANVVDTGPGALRGYLANIDEVGVEGVELDVQTRPWRGLIAYATLAWTDAVYESFANGPCPLELIGPSTSACDLSGQRLPGVSEWAWSVGGEYRWPGAVAGDPGDYYVGVDASYRSDFYSDASDSRYALIDGYTLVNLRAGFESEGGWEAFAWVKNAFDEPYLQFVSVQSGNSGLILGNPGDPRTIGATLRVRR